MVTAIQKPQYDATEKREARVPPLRVSASPSAAVGVALVVFGGILLVTQFVNVGAMLLPALALVFIAFGIASRQAGLLIPGGIVGGIGLGIALTSGPLSNLTGGYNATVFLLSFAAGWVSITLLTAAFTDTTHWWALIPAACLSIVGLAIPVVTYAPEVLFYVSMLWPLALVAVGLYLLLTHREARV